MSVRVQLAKLREFEEQKTEGEDSSHPTPCMHACIAVALLPVRNVKRRSDWLDIHRGSTISSPELARSLCIDGPRIAGTTPIWTEVLERSHLTGHTEMDNVEPPTAVWHIGGDVPKGNQRRHLGDTALRATTPQGCTMDYETLDGSQFSLRAVWTKQDGKPVFDYTTISAYVEGVAYVGKLYQPPHQVDETDVLNSLEPVPPQCIRPEFPENFTLASEVDPAVHYLKAPSFTYDDCRPGNTFVADCVLNEVSVLERLKAKPHPNLASYHGCVVKDGLITHICSERYPASLAEHVNSGINEEQETRLLSSIEAGIGHLHALGLAHNDINPDNICIDADGNAVVLDFDGCLPFGEKLSEETAGIMASKLSLSNRMNDLIHGLGSVEEFLRLGCDGEHPDPDSSRDMGVTQN
ncbi:hypothetical protein LTR37_005475 [Vermiconidia calcicola]|uniref:Uncharacterized protein n=1 Tax=Vermiconidia calcicola TaxID=1690605 RepID=A0ACC3NKE6_9PEZI|nr:hypothetical protein LTR37_005475 [Vermiconidia calcicola]